LYQRQLAKALASSKLAHFLEAFVIHHSYQIHYYSYPLLIDSAITFLNMVSYDILRQFFDALRRGVLIVFSVIQVLCLGDEGLVQLGLQFVVAFCHAYGVHGFRPVFEGYVIVLQSQSHLTFLALMCS
jgi:hypothetical protein